MIEPMLYDPTIWTSVVLFLVGLGLAVVGAFLRPRYCHWCGHRIWWWEAKVWVAVESVWQHEGCGQ